jgi:hypothetical protein
MVHEFKVAKLLINLELDYGTRDPVSDERRKILDWLSKFNYWDKQKDFFGRTEPGTCQWFLDSAKFKGWMEGEKRVLWCPSDRNASNCVIANDGTAGVGKTFLRLISL